MSDDRTAGKIKEIDKCFIEVDTANCTDYKTWPVLPRLLLRRFEHSGSSVMKKPGHIVRFGDNFYRSG